MVALISRTFKDFQQRCFSYDYKYLKLSVNWPRSQRFEKDTILSIIYKIRNTWYVKHNVDKFETATLRFH